MSDAEPEAADPGPEPAPPAASPRAWLIPVMVLLFIGLIALAAGLALSASEHGAGEQTWPPGKAATDDGLDIHLSIVQIDPVVGTVMLRARPEAHPLLLGEDGFTLARSIVIDVNSVVGDAERKVRRGERLGSFDFAIPLSGDSARRYPFDRHRAILHFMVSPLEDDAHGNLAPIPLRLLFDDDSNGYAITTALNGTPHEDYCSLALSIHRSPRVLCFAVFLMCLAWLIGLIGIIVVTAVLSGRRDMKEGQVTWLASLLFSMLPLRNGMPDAPPALGCVSDFAAFIWAEGILTICLVILVYHWFIRPSAPESPPR